LSSDLNKVPVPVTFFPAVETVPVLVEDAGTVLLAASE